MKKTIFRASMFVMALILILTMPISCQVRNSDTNIDDPSDVDQAPPNDGKSAYEIAVQNGFKGSEEEWFSSLIGDQETGEVEGFTPQLRINDSTNHWEVSCDNGETWWVLNITVNSANVAGAYVDKDYRLWVVLSDGTKIDTGYTGELATAPESSPKPDPEENAPTITVPHVLASAGETIEVAVSVKNNPGIAGAKLTLVYHSKLTLTSVAEGVAFDAIDYTAPANLKSGCAFNWDSLTGEATEDGEILLLTFQISEHVSVGDVLIVTCTYEEGDIYDENIEDVFVNCVYGSITIQ